MKPGPANRQVPKTDQVSRLVGGAVWYGLVYIEM